MVVVVEGGRYKTSWRGQENQERGKESSKKKKEKRRKRRRLRV